MNELLAAAGIEGNLGASLADLMALFLIVGARPLGFVLLHPVFGHYGINTGLLRGAVLVAMTFPVLPSASAAAMANPEMLSAGAIPFFMVRELIVGGLLGLICGVPFWIAIAAGEILDSQRGASMATLQDATGAQTSVSGMFFFLATILSLTASGLLIPALFGPLLRSYQLFPAPADFAFPDIAQGGAALGLLDDILRGGLILAFPILIPLLLTEVMIAISSKYMQQLNPVFMAMTVKQIVYVLLLVLYVPILARYVIGLGDQGRFSAEALARFLSGAAR